MPAELVRLRAILEGTVNHVDAQWDRCDGGPAPGSKAAAEIAAEEEWSAPWATRPLYDAHGAAALLILAATDQIRGMWRTVDALPLPWASDTLARTCAEQAARGWWLLDPEVGSRGRFARHVTEQIYSWWEASRAGFTVKSGTDPGLLIDEVTTSMSERGFKIVLRHDGLPCVDEVRLSTTRLLERMLPNVGRDLYAHLSPIVHGTLGGVMGVVSAPEDRDIGVVGVDLEALLTTTSSALIAFFPAFDRIVTHFGWELDAWSSWAKYARRAMGELWSLVDRD